MSRSETIGSTRAALRAGSQLAIEVGANDYAARPFDPGLSEDIKIILTSEGATIAGAVLDDRGEPASYGSVVIFSADAQDWYSDPRLVQLAPVGAEGRFDGIAVPAGNYMVIAVDELDQSDWPPRPEVLELLCPLADQTLDFGARRSEDAPSSAGADYAMT